MNRPALAALALAGLLLTGCAASPADANVPRETSAPLVAATTTAPGATLSLADAKFVQSVRDVLFRGAGASIPDTVADESLVAAGHKACELLASGTDFLDVTVIDGEQRAGRTYRDSAVIAAQAITAYCPEFTGSNIIRKDG